MLLGVLVIKFKLQLFGFGPVMPLLEAPETLEVPLGLEGQSTQGSITLKLEMDVAPASKYCLFPITN